MFNTDYIQTPYHYAYKSGSTNELISNILLNFNNVGNATNNNNNNNGNHIFNIN